MKLQILAISTMVGLTFLLSGCGSRTVEVSTNTGFFENYKQTTTQTKVKPTPTNYLKIQIAPVQVVSGMTQGTETPSQKKMYAEIAAYLNAGYKEIVNANARYSISDSKANDTLVLESAISTVEVHYDDPSWNQHTPIEMGLDTISFNAYMYEFVRVLGESKLVDSLTGKVISRSMKIQKDHKIKITGDDLVFADVKPALDTWLAQVKVDLSSK